MRLIRTATTLVLAASVAGCFKGVEKTPEAGQKGQFGVFYVVNVSRPVGGTITSTTDGQVNCGTAGSGKDACTAVYDWKVAASFAATPDAGLLFQSWAADCSGTATCTVDTVTNGADKTIAAVFNPPDRLGHAKIPDPSQHAPLFFDFIKKVPNTPQCTRCHGADYKGLANAPSCETCHANAGFPDWLNNCNFCHSDPPATPHVQSNLCSSCHAGYGDATGTGIQATNAATHMNGRVDVSGAACTMCHGTPNVNAAPPIDTLGRSATTLVSVGAHQIHLNTSMAKPVACGECHVVPTDATHATQSPASKLAFGPLANLGTTTVWSSANATCAASYCHGGTSAVAGGLRTTPTWTQVDGTFRACTACHGAPPPAPHAQNADCGMCHLGYSITSANAATHVNGVVDVRPMTCSSCHGDALRTGVDPNIAAAPPLGTQGETLNTQPAVGAHMAHLNSGRLAGAFACTDCHNPPTATTHATGAVEFSFSVLAGGSSVVYDPATATCSNVYCHGNFAGGNRSNKPVWTAGAAGQVCGTCHGAPPPAPHTQSTACNGCHPGYTVTSVNLTTHVNGIVDVVNMTCTSCHGSTNVNPAPPVDTQGRTLTTLVSVGAHQAHVTTTMMAAPVACTECHGAASGSYGTGHADGTVQVQFGPKANLGTSTLWSNGSASCSASYCHGGTAAVAGGSGTTPIWTQVDGTFKGCGSCHGSPPAVASHPASSACGSCHPGYTSSTVAASSHINGSVDVVLGPTSCTICHGAPPATASHRTAGGLNTCSKCHDQTVDGAGTILASGKHRNGVVDLSTQMTCAKCHGTEGRTANPTAFADSVAGAPPLDLSGNTTPTAPGVGAHLVHVNGLRSKNLLCSECHDVASVMTGLYSHADGTVNMAWGTTATAGGVAPTYVLGSGSSCNNTYCHGNFAGGRGAGASPAWTAAGTLSCTSCHDAPPALSATTHHPANANCAACHGTNYSATTVAQATHVDGAVTLSRTGCTLCHGDLTQTGVASGAVTAAPGVNASAADTTGSVLASSAAVGAHAAHLTGTRWSAAPMACSACHAVPAGGDVSHATGVGSGGARATVAFSGLATTGSITTAAYAGSSTASGGNQAGSCSNVYCHGNFKNGATTQAPSWLGGATAAACGSCHGLPPGGTHPANANCGTCHSGYTASTVNAANHLNGNVDVVAMSCTSCHGDGTRVSVAGADLNQGAAPPVDTKGATTGVRVGTHGSHVNPAAAGQVYKAVGCVECHPDNAGNAAHSDNVVNVTFATATGGNLAGFTPGFVQGDGTATQTTCTTYCHGASLNATTTRGSVAAWSWNGAAADCGSCHKSPPTTANHHNAAAVTTCTNCHAGTVNASGAIVVAGNLHINGTIDTSTLTCTSCHGGSTNAATGTRDPNVAAAPTGTGAPDTYGSVLTTQASVGVHASHVLGARSRAVQCNACHVVPTQPIHKTGTATAGTVTFGNLANTGAVSSTYAGAGGTCSNTYCHGNFSGGAGAGTTPTWTATGTLSCTACHGAPPALSATTHHPSNTSCATCHGTGYSSSTVAAATHVDGTVTLSRTGCTLCHGDLTQTGVAATSSLAAPGYTLNAADTAGNTAATFAAVGAHAAHLTGTRWTAAPIACSACHAVPAANDVSHATGVGSGGARATVTFSGLAVTGAITTAAYAGSTTASGANGAGTCSNVYCHGNFKNGATTLAPSWLGGAAAADCGSCHGLPPGGNHPASSNCASCHSGYTASTVNTALHMNGSVDVINMTCTSCHGTAGRVSVAGADLNQASAPPLDTLGAATGVRVGTHGSHVNPAAAGQVYKAVGCVECHPDNAGNNSHSNNVVNVTFATATGANLAGFTPGFVQGNGSTTQTTCTTYCHGASLDATTSRGSVATWSWNGAAADCGSCHKAPPTTANHHNAAALTTCSKCHGGTVDAAGVVNVAGGLHVNGAVDTAGLSCTACHGGSANAATGLRDPNVAAAPTGTGAPDTYGNTTVTTANGVGAHAAHVLGNRSRPVTCDACHVVPTQNVHKTGVATAGTVTFGNLANTGTVTSTYAGAGGTCSNTYCHGNFAGGAGAGATPVWKSATALSCTACHGAPPALSATTHHPSNTNCVACHGTGYSSSTVVQATHIDGAVTLSRTGCTLCHGDLTQTAVAASSSLAAPGYTLNAADTAGNTAATFAAVGAHAAHLTGTRWTAAPMACSACHTVPGTGDVAHATGVGSGGARATVTFSGLATTGSITTAAYAGSTTASGANGAGTCSNVYCHGNFKNGATTLAPSWLGGSAAANCGTCHGLPPGGNHPASNNCASCHSGYTISTVNAALHMNGSVDVINMTCTSCHGDGTRVSVAGADLNQASAPPLDSFGAATGVRVGQHVSHVNPAATNQVYKAVACVECHPNNAGNTSHGNNVRDVTFATATGANLAGFTPGFVLGDGTTSQTTCTTYCHGASLNATTSRGSVATWSWNATTAFSCGSCHQSPPGTANHHNAAALTTCSKCHGGTVNASGVVNVAAGLHINGSVDTAGLTCSACHGGSANAATGTRDPNVAAAPTGTGAPDTYGRTATTFASVGVHGSHVLGARSRAVQCNACHAVPTQNVHKTGVATSGTVALGGLSTTGGITTATYAGAGGTCSNTYCHGSLGGGIGTTNVTPLWTSAATLACATCHGVPPAQTSTGHQHPNRTDCGSCHAGYTGTTVNALTHVDGTVQYNALGCTSCHGDPARTGLDAGGVAFSVAPPADSSGLLTGGTKIGAHVKHLLTGAAGGPGYSAQVACAECHSAAIPATNLHADGQPNVAFGTLARTGTGTTFPTPSYAAGSGATAGTCSNTYCHGNFANGAGAVAISWTTTVTCGSCHGLPPGGTHPAATVTTCGNCHGNYDNVAAASNPATAIINPALHVDGSVDLSRMSCTSCHGTPGRASVAGADLNQPAAPPVDSKGATSGVRVGVHVSHVNPAAAGQVYKAVACTECHPNNTSNTHGNSVRDVTFATATGANLGGLTPGFTLGDGLATQTTCTTYCHGATLNTTTTRGSVASWGWNGAAATCGSCHKAPPTTANHHNAAAVTTCTNCHSGTVNASGAIVVAGNLHIDGKVDVSTLTCTSCHGGSANAATGTRDPNVAAAPTGTGAPDTYGNAVATAAGVGVHAAHVLGTRSKPVLCNACHTVPTQNVHKTGTATAGAVTLGNLALTGAITNASYAGSGGTCANTYCHGNLKGGATGASTSLSWTTAGTLACNACHGAPPTTTSTGHYHPQRTDCGSCHAGYGASTVNAATHVDGVIQVNTMACTSCHGTAGTTGAIAGVTYDANLAAAPPADSLGRTTTGLLVGAHQAHVNPTASVAGASQPSGGVMLPIACTECHPDNSGNQAHADGTLAASFDLATVSGLNGVAKTITPSAGATAATCTTYCHGAKLPDGSTGGLTPSWTGSAATCSSCHGFPPVSAAHNGPPVVASNATACATCHSDTVNPDGTIKIAGGKHINGTVDAVKGNTCSGCHGFGMAAATGYHHVMATDPGTGYPVSNAPTLDADKNCNVCHMKHEFADKAANLRNTINAGPTAASTDAPLCISCHEQNEQVKDTTRQATDGTVRTPLVDSAAFNASAHAYAVTGTFGTAPTASNFTVACVKCHNSASPTSIQTGAYQFALHDSPDRRLRAPLGRTGLTDDDSAAFCYRCHSNAADTLPGTKKAVSTNDWYGAVTTMPAGSTGVFTQMQKGTAGTTTSTNQAATTLYLRNNATVNAAEGNLPTAYILASGTYAGTTTFSQFDMALTAGATATTRTNNSGTTNTRYLRFGQFVSPPVATSVTIPSGSVFQVKTRAQVSASGDVEFERFQIWRRTSAGVNTAFNTATQESATQLTTTATNRTFNFTTNTAITLGVGDILVLEIETRKNSTTSSTVTENYGNFASDAASLVLPASITFVSSPAVAASGRHDVGSYVGKHRPNPAEETLAYIGANKHVDCADCHDPHKARRGNQGDAGTVSAAATGCANTTTTLCDSTQNWAVDAWKGYWLDTYTVSSSAAVSRALITGNTANQITVGAAITTPVATTVGYRVSLAGHGGKVSAASAAGSATLTDSTESWPVNVFQGGGWYVHVVAGAGAGQSALIASNTATVLTIAGTWTTALSATSPNVSAYVISKVPGVMQGASGVKVAAWGSQAQFAWGETNTFSPAAGSAAALPDATAQWQVCFKCHSDANTQLTTWSAGFTDLAQDFNPRNRSYHPVVAQAGAVAGTSGYGNTTLRTTELWKGWKPGDVMTCGDCHGNDDQTGTASHGPHASAVKYILKGPNTRWPFRADGTTRWVYGTAAGSLITDSIGTKDGLFCLNCHSSTLVSTPHSNRSAHRVACTGCHLRIPHGGKVARLIRTTNTPAPYVDSGFPSQLRAYNHSTSLVEGSCGSVTSGCTNHSLAANPTTAPVNAW